MVWKKLSKDEDNKESEDEDNEDFEDEDFEEESENFLEEGFETGSFRRNRNRFDSSSISLSADTPIENLEQGVTNAPGGASRGNETRATNTDYEAANAPMYSAGDYNGAGYEKNTEVRMPADTQVNVGVRVAHEQEIIRSDRMPGFERRVNTGAWQREVMGGYPGMNESRQNSQGERYIRAPGKIDSDGGLPFRKKGTDLKGRQI